VPIGAIDASLYRDDIGLRPVSPGSVSDIPFGIDGTTVVLVDRFDPLPFVETLEREHIATCNMVPSMIARLLDEVPDIASRDFSLLEVIHYGAAPISVPLLRRALHREGHVKERSA